MIKELNLFDFNRSMVLLSNTKILIQKCGNCVGTYDKPFYGAQDIRDLQKIQKYIPETFTERGKRTANKQLLSSKEKEVWNCECGKTNDIDTFCFDCGLDIF